MKREGWSTPSRRRVTGGSSSIWRPWLWLLACISWCWMRKRRTEHELSNIFPGRNMHYKTTVLEILSLFHASWFDLSIGSRDYELKSLRRFMHTPKRRWVRGMTESAVD